MVITVVCVGKIKEKYFTDAIKEYSKRLSRYCDLKVIEVPDEPTPDGASEAQEQRIRRTEGDRILKMIKPDDYVIALAIKGHRMTSEQLAASMQQKMVHGIGRVTFVIGGSLGLSEEVLRRANEPLSFSDMTFPHQLMRVILLEQIYRSFRIMRNEPYHK